MSSVLDTVQVPMNDCEMTGYAKKNFTVLVTSSSSKLSGYLASMRDLCKLFLICYVFPNTEKRNQKGEENWKYKMW